jgi:hypothetical protein
MSWTLCTSGSAVVKAGVYANSSIILSGSILAQWSDQKEGRIEAETRRSWVSNYATLPTGIKNILADICSSLIAKEIISYDTSGYQGNSEVITRLNVQDDVAREGLNILKDFKSNTLHTP